MSYPASDKLDEIKEQAKKEMESPLTRIHYAAKGKLEVIEAVEELVYQAESGLRKLHDENARRERHSGFGRGDSMG